MEPWDETVLNNNSTCAQLGPKCLQLLGMHAVSGCDTTSHPFSKGKISALKTLTTGNFPGLSNVMGDVAATHEDLLEVANTFFAALYGKPPGTSIESAHFTLFSKRKKIPKVMVLPPASTNLLLHMLRTYLQVMLWKSADKKSPPDEFTDITNCGWEIRDGIPVPAIASGDPAPPELIDVIVCHCSAKARKCSTGVCGCHSDHLSCASYCSCSGDETCCNPYTKRGEAQDSATGDEDVEMEDAEEEDIEEELTENEVAEEDGDIEDDFSDPDDQDDEWE